MRKYLVRLLRAEEIECRVACVKENGLSLLLYKDARVDQRILDETFGAFGWQRSHQCINGNLYCTVEIYDPSSGLWIAKQDVGTMGYTEIAAMTFDFLFQTGNKAATNCYQKERNHAIKSQGYFNGSGIRNAFLIGYLEGIKECLEKQCTALMITIPKEVEESYTNLTAEFEKASSSLSYKDSSEGKRVKEEGKRTGKTAIMSRGIEETFGFDDRN